MLGALTLTPQAGEQDSQSLSGLEDSAYLWKHVAIGAGGFITGYRSDDRGITRVARADTYGAYIWKEEPGGAKSGRWAQLMTSASMPEQYRNPRALNAGVYEIAVAPGDARRIYMVVKGRIFRSDDAGQNFRDISTPDLFPVEVNANGPYRTHGPFMAVSPSNADHVLLGTPENGLLRSDDGGEHWSLVESVPKSADLDGRKDGIQAPGHAILFSRGADGEEVVYVAAPGHGVYVSRDGARNFAPLAGAEDGPLSIKQFIRDLEGRLVAVDDSGRTVWRHDGARWDRLLVKERPQTGNLASIAVDRATGRLYVYQNFRTIYMSDDGEAWWRLPVQVRTSAGDPPWLVVTNMSFAVSQIAPDPLVKNRFWAAAGTGVYFADIDPDLDPESDPEKAPPVTWTSLTRGIEQLVTNDVYQAPGRAPLFAVWDFGIHRKENLDTFSTGFGPIERMIISAQQVVGTPANPDFAVTNASDHLRCCAEDGNSIMAGYSEDGGKKWKKFQTLPTPPGTDPNDPWRMSFGMIAVSSSNPDNIVWVPSFNRAPFYTRDRGASWQQVHFPGERGDMTGSHADFYLPRRVLTADPVAGGTFYLVHSGNPGNRHLQGLWVTRDGGENWQRVFEGEIAPLSLFSARLRAVPGREGDLFFTSQVDGNVDTRLRRSKDGGKTWSIIDEAQHVDDISFGRALEAGGPPTIFLSGQVRGEYGIWRSTDDAASWRKIGNLPVGTLDQVVTLGANPDVFGEVYIGYMGSGWIYGKPADCKPQPYLSGDDSECFASRP